MERWKIIILKNRFSKYNLSRLHQKSWKSSGPFQKRIAKYLYGEM